MNKFVASANYGPFAGQLFGDYVGRRFATYTNDLSVPSYFELNLEASYKVPLPEGASLRNALVQVNVTNLTNEKGRLYRGGRRGVWDLQHLSAAAAHGIRHPVGGVLMAPSRRGAMQGAAGAAALATMSLASGARAHMGRPRVPRVQVFGHRGACALRPEHTLASYALAVADGADYVEPDLVITKDGVLVARHENNIAETTDVAAHPEFADRRATKLVDGETTSGWFTEDFTLAEMKTLRAIERLPKIRPQNTVYNCEFQVPTFAEYMDFIAAQSALLGRPIGMVPEIKHSTYFASIGLPMEDRFLAELAAHSYARTAPVEIQSFEIANLRYIRRKLGHPSNVRLMQLGGRGRRASGRRGRRGRLAHLRPDVRARGARRDGDLRRRSGSAQSRDHPLWPRRPAGRAHDPGRRRP